MTRHSHREVVVDALLELVQRSQSMGGGEVDFRLGDRVGHLGRRERVNGHVWSPNGYAVGRL